MKKVFIAAIAGMLLLSPHAFSAGILVFDTVAIAKTIEEGLNRAQEAKAAFDQATKDYEQAKSIGEDAKRRFEGYSDYSDLFDTAASYMKDDLSALAEAEDIGGLRDKYGLVSDDEGVQQRYDGELQKIALYDNFNKQLTKGAQQLDTLQGRFESATTPQQKQDIANQIELEMVKTNAVIQQYQFAQGKISQEAHIEAVKRADEFKKAHTYTGG
jgi:type IV secretion system protein VirB5